MLEPFSLIFFDFDGTLCASEADIRNAWCKTLSALSVECPSFDAVFKVGPSLAEMTSRLFPDRSEDFRQKIIVSFKNFYDDSTFDETVPYPWVDAFLKKLVANGKKIFVVTNKRKKPTSFLLKKFGWDRLFSDFYSPDSVPGKNSGKSELLGRALNDCGEKTSAALMVGDTAADIRAGNDNGMKTAGVVWGYGSRAELETAGADFILSEKDISEWTR